MRWKLLAVPVVLLLVQATAARSQEVPVTMTMQAEADNHPTDQVDFYDAFGKFLGSAEERVSAYQKTVGFIGPDENGRYGLLAKVIIGGSEHDYPFSFDSADHCTEEPHSGQILRVACSLVKYGAGMVCTAIYEGMEDPLPECGSQQCILCSGVRVCGSNPTCTAH